MSDAVAKNEGVEVMIVKSVEGVVVAIVNEEDVVHLAEIEIEVVVPEVEIVATEIENMIGIVGGLHRTKIVDTEDHLLQSEKNCQSKKEINGPYSVCN